MPWQKALPSVLAVVLVNQRHVVVAAPIFRPLVKAVEFTKSPTQFLDLRFRHAIEILTLFQFAVLVSVFVGRTFIDFEGSRRGLDVAGIDLFDRDRRLSSGNVERSLMIARGTSIIDPLRDEVDLFFRDSLSAPGQSWILCSVERRLAAQAADQSRSGAATFSRWFRRSAVTTRRSRRFDLSNHAHAVNLNLKKLRQRQLPESTQAIVVSRTAGGAPVEDLFDLFITSHLRSVEHGPCSLLRVNLESQFFIRARIQPDYLL